MHIYRSVCHDAGVLRVLASLGGAAALVALFLVLRPAPAPDAPGEIAVDVVVTARALEPARIVVREGASVTLRFAARDGVRLHVHGYDIERALAPGAVAAVTFTATLTGRFEIEDEATDTPLGELVVEPRAP